MPFEVKRQILVQLHGQDFMNTRHSCKAMYTAAASMQERRKFVLKRFENFTESIQAATYLQGFFKELNATGSSLVFEDPPLQIWQKFFISFEADILRLEGLRITNKAIKFLKNNSYAKDCLDVLILTNNSISEQGGKYLGLFLKSTNNRLVYLGLCHNPLKDKGIQNMCESLQIHQYIKFLTLNDCDIKNEGARSLAITLAKNTSLKVLELNNNYIQNDGIIAISESLFLNRNLKILRVENNLITDKGVLHLAKSVLENPIIRILELYNNLVSSKSIEVIHEMLDKEKIIGL